MELTKENYFSLEAGKEYMSNSQFKNFVECEAMAMALINGEITKEPSDAMLQGSYVHAWNEGGDAMQKFLQKNPQMFKKDGSLYAKYENMNNVIESIKDDELFMRSLAGENEVILTAEMYGCTWKIMLDSIDTENNMWSDLKVLADYQKDIWNKELKLYESILDVFGYIRAVAIYSEITKKALNKEVYLEPYLSIATKEKVPDKIILSFVSDEFGNSAQDRYKSLVEFVQNELNYVEDRMPRINAVKSGEEAPKSCGKCDYCKSKKKLTGTVHYSQLMPYGKD